MTQGGSHHHGEAKDTREARLRTIVNSSRVCLNNPRVDFGGYGRLHIFIFGILWGFQQVSCIVVGGPAPNLYVKDVASIPSILERTAFDFLQRASASFNTGMQTEVDSSSSAAKARDIPRRNAWELISSSSDVIPLRSRFHNGSSPNFVQWSAAGGSNGGGGLLLNPQFSVETRLQRLEHHFNSLRVYDDDCRQRLLCEIAESPAKFAPLTNAFLDETSFNGDEKSLASKLLETNEGTKLLTYIEATQRGVSRQGCEIWTYRCPRTASTMIDFKGLLMWREISKWLTIKFVAKKHQT